jgi:D-alanine-D-alanine ligase
MKRALSIAVIYGGVSGEHEVSLQSAASVMKALDKAKYDVTPILIDKRGRWHFKRKDKELSSFDVVFPLVHGTFGEDGTLQGLLEMAGVAYVGSGVLGSALGMDKVVQKMVLERAGLPVTPSVAFKRADWETGRRGIVARIERRLGYPAFVKPANLGSSVGVTKAHHRKELLAGIEEALDYDVKIIVEKAVPNAREIECAVIGNDEPRVSALGEIVPSNEFYDYAAKYLDGKSQAIIPAALPSSLAAKIAGLAKAAYVALDAAGFARVDCFVNRETGEAFVNEINTIPGFTSISMFPKLWEASGLPFRKLLDELVRLALERARARRRLRRSFSPATV